MLFLEHGKNFSGVAIGRAREDKVCLTLRKAPAELCELLLHACALRDYLFGVALHVFDVVESCKGNGLGDAVEVVGVLYLVHCIDELLGTYAIAEAKSCEGVGLGECP